MEKIISDGCNQCGPFEICGHTNETCPKNNEAAVFALDPTANKIEHDNTDKNYIAVNEFGVSKGGVLKTDGMVPCSAIFLRDKNKNIGALGHFQPYSIRQQDFHDQSPDQVAINEISEIIKQMKIKGADIANITALTLRSNQNKENKYDDKWSETLLLAINNCGIKEIKDEIHEGDIKEIEFDIDNKKITVSYHKRNKSKKEILI